MNVMTLGSKSACGTVIKPDGSIKVTIAGGMISKIAIKKKLSKHKTAQKEVMQVDRLTVYDK